MQLEYSLTEDDLLNFNVYHLKHSRVARRNYWKSMAVFTLSFFVCMTFVLYRKLPQPQLSLIAFTLALVTCWLYSFYYKSCVRRQTRKLLLEGANKGLCKPVRLTLAVDGIRAVSEYGESFTRWPAVERMAETPAYIYLYLSAVNALIIPKDKIEVEIPVHQLFGRIRALAGAQG